MKNRNNIFSAVFNCLTIIGLGIGLADLAVADQKVQAGHHQPPTGRIYGKVTQTMDAAGYTYAEVDTGNEKFWAAARKTVLNKGDMIAFSMVMPMKNYYSKSLKREFSVVYFVNRFITDEDPATNADSVQNASHAGIKSQQITAPVTDIKKVEGGHTIAEIYNNKKSLKGKTVRVRGKVTKYTAKVMGKNWIHIMDSSTHNDLTVTTDKVTAVNDVVVIEGQLVLDKDYNYGYVYPLIVENANVLK